MTAMAAPEVRTRPGRRAGRQLGQGARLCLGMLRGALVGAHAGLLAAVGLAAVLDGGVGAANAAVAGALVIVFFATGQAVQMLAGEMADGTGMAMLMTSYMLRVLAMGGVLYAAMAHQDRLDAVLDRPMFFLGAMAALLGWLVGIVVTHARQRVFVYDRDADSAIGGSM